MISAFFANLLQIIPILLQYILFALLIIAKSLLICTQADFADVLFFAIYGFCLIYVSTIFLLIYAYLCLFMLIYANL